MPHSGVLVLVVGPSGAGKDTLLAAARQALADDPRFLFPRRVVTRSATPSLEDHDSVGAGQFAAMRQAGEFALAWEAHGLSYGLPAEIEVALTDGRVVVCNGARRVLGLALERYPHCRVLLITADREVRANRLAARGRESRAEIEERLEREGDPVPAGVRPVVIDNSGALSVSAVATLVALLNIAADEPLAG